MSGTSASGTAGFSAQERAAMKERAAELRKEAERGDKAAAAEREVLDKIAGMADPDGAIAARIHAQAQQR